LAGGVQELRKRSDAMMARTLAIFGLVALGFVGPAAAQQGLKAYRPPPKGSERVTFEAVLHASGRARADGVVYRLTRDENKRLAHLHGLAARFEGWAVPGQRPRKDGLVEQRLRRVLVTPLKETPPHIQRLEAPQGIGLTEREGSWMWAAEEALASRGGATLAELQKLAQKYMKLWRKERLRLWAALLYRGGSYRALGLALARPPVGRAERRAPPPPPLDWARYVKEKGALEKAQEKAPAKPAPTASSAGAAGRLGQAQPAGPHRASGPRHPR
jgi:hypothetical protein